MSSQQETETYTLSMEREFDAPRELVFNAFMDPDQLAAWFGPEGVDTPRDRITVEPRVGGAWSLVMVYEDDGVHKESPINSIITQYEPPRLIEAAERESDESTAAGEVLRMRLEFEDIGGRTLLKLTQSGFTSQEWVDMTREGWDSSFTILDKELAATSDTAS
ncbi:SRPBCC family protein [Pseudarthrobacter sp. N5]|uniref:SRPBCC family protein n=1 Tax=Pseudarthrobacter sp. N5 TaxID=3418416 RepID=UPI003CFA0E64